MRKFLLCYILLFIGLSTHAQSSQNSFKLTILDEIYKSPFWPELENWDKLYENLHIRGKRLDKLLDYSKDPCSGTEPCPRFIVLSMKEGTYQAYYISGYRDTLRFEVDLHSDTTIYFQELIKDFYQKPGAAEDLFPAEENFKSPVTVRISSYGA